MLRSEHSILPHSTVNVPFTITHRGEHLIKGIEERQSLALCDIDNHCDNRTSGCELTTSRVLSEYHSPRALQAFCYKQTYRKEPRKISPEFFRKQLQDTSDITMPCVLLPCMKKGMEIPQYDIYTFATTPHNSSNKVHQNLYERNCITKTETNEIDTTELNLLPLGHKRQIDPNIIKRITRKRKVPIRFTNENTVYFSGTQDSVEYVIRNEDVETVDFEALTRDGDVRNYIFMDDNVDSIQEITADQEDSTILIESDTDSNLYTCRTSGNMDVLLAAASNDQHLVVFCQKITSSGLSAERLETGTYSTLRDHSL